MRQSIAGFRGLAFAALAKIIFNFIFEKSLFCILKLF